MERTCFIFFILFSISLISISKAKNEATTTAIYIIIVQTPEGIQPDAYYLKILSTALGSKETAKNALVYSYIYATFGFAARLTKKQASDVSKQPSVIDVSIDKTYSLYPGQSDIPHLAGLS